MAAFRFRKKTDYGLAMVGLVANYDGEYMSVSEMQDHGLPRSFLVKIAQDLIDHGILGSKEGRGGGYFLACDPKTTSLKKVVEALEGKISTAECVHGVECPFADKCPQKDMMVMLTRDIENVLDKYSISDLR